MTPIQHCIKITLQTLVVLVVGLVVINIWSIVQAYLSLSGNPLLPRTLAPYAAFPRYFIIFGYGVIIFLTIRILKNTEYYKFWWYPVLFLVCFEFLKFYLYGLLMWMNPFG